MNRFQDEIPFPSGPGWMMQRVDEYDARVRKKEELCAKKRAANLYWSGGRRETHDKYNDHGR